MSRINVAYITSLRSAQLERRDARADVDPADEPTIAAALAAALPHIPPGNDHASEYHNLMIGAVEFLFFPRLIYPRKEHEIHEGRKRIDIVMENAARSGPFSHVATIRNYPAAYVFFECKNYGREVGNPEIDQLSGRFSRERGKVGFLCCRQFEDRDRFVMRCRDTFQARRAARRSVAEYLALGHGLPRRRREGIVVTEPSRRPLIRTSTRKMERFSDRIGATQSRRQITQPQLFHSGALMPMFKRGEPAKVIGCRAAARAKI